MTWLLALAGLQFGYSVPAFGSQAAVLETLRGFFLEPFLDGHQYHLYLAAWFVLQLYLVHLVFQAVVWSPGRTAALATLAAAIPVALFALGRGLAGYDDLRLTLVRTAFAFLFYLLGYTVKREERRLRPLLVAPAAIAVEFALVNLLAIQFGNIRYNLVLGNIGNQRVWVPLATTLLIVLMVYALAHHLAGWLAEDALLLRIGRATMPIMVWHFSIFFAVNCALFALGLITKANLSDNWFALAPKQTWLLYEVPAVAVPLLVTEAVRRRRAGSA